LTNHYKSFIVTGIDFDFPASMIFNLAKIYNMLNPILTEKNMTGTSLKQNDNS